MKKCVSLLFVVMLAVVTMPAFAQECGTAPNYEPCYQDFPPDDGGSGGGGGGTYCKRCVPVDGNWICRTLNQAPSWDAYEVGGSLQCQSITYAGFNYCEESGGSCTGWQYYPTSTSDQSRLRFGNMPEAMVSYLREIGRLKPPMGQVRPFTGWMSHRA
jgi:hypothetical protein